MDYEKNQADPCEQKYPAERLAPYYYQERELGHSTEEVGKLILKINSLPADKRASFSTDEIRLMRTAINQLRNERLAKGLYTDAADDMLLKLF